MSDGMMLGGAEMEARRLHRATGARLVGWATEKLASSKRIRAVQSLFHASSDGRSLLVDSMSPACGRYARNALLLP